MQPATAARNGGYCGPCAGRAAEAERAEFVRRNRRDVDPYAGLTDPVELLWRMHEPRRYDALVKVAPPPQSFEALYTSLDRGQAERLMGLAAAAVRGKDTDRADDVARHLAAFTDFNLDPMLGAWAEAGRYWPALTFRGAGAAIRDAAFGALDGLGGDGAVVEVDHLLQALAWVRDDAVARRFAEWQAAPPAWAAGLHVGPADYARVAGWEVEGGRRRELTFGQCVGMMAGGPAGSGESAVRVFRPARGVCRFCGRGLVNLLDIDLRDGRFAFLGVTGPRLAVATCEMCTCYGDFLYAELDAAGEGHWAEENQAPAFLPSDRDWLPSPWAAVAVELVPRPPLRGAEWGLPTTLSQVGGVPGWVQDTAYPPCRRCGRTMCHLGQVDNGAFPAQEGVYYAFLCAACRVTATVYQQT